MEKIVIVGGGIAGIVSALFLSKQGYNVSLVDKDKSIGGLLKSIQFDETTFFDYGTHLLRQTGIPELDELLFGEISQKNWNILAYPKAGSFYKQLSAKNSFLNTCALPEEKYNQAMMELLNITENPSAEFDNLQALLISKFGKTLTEELFRPILEKFFPVKLEDLSPTAHYLVGLTRIIAFTPQVSQLLKQIPIYDGKLGFHSFTEGISSLKSFYPHNEGVGSWINQLEAKLVSSGVKLFTNTFVQSVQHQQENIKSITLNTGKILDCDTLIWTIPTFLLAKAAQLTPNFPLQPPKRLTTVILNYIIDQPYNTDLHYLQCYDTNYQTFRTTLYNNITPRKDGKYLMTVELFAGKVEATETLVERIFIEQKEMGIIPNQTNIITYDSVIIPNGFPIQTKDFTQSVKGYYNLATTAFQNLILTGKATGTQFFMNEVLVKTYQMLQKKVKHDNQKVSV